MNTNCTMNPASHTRRANPSFWATALACLPLASAVAANTNLNFTATGTVKEWYDDNVFIQNVTPSSAIPKAALPYQSTMGSSVGANVGVSYTGSPAFAATVNYLPEANFYYRFNSEDNFVQKGLLTLKGGAGEWNWTQANTFNYVLGSSEGLYFGGPGGAPSIGGLPTRDRRAQFWYRGGLTANYVTGKWLFRPVCSLYFQDFFTEQHDTTLPQYRGYENYIDRNDINGGFDVGYTVAKNTRVLVGYRYGHQDQGALVNDPYQYDNRYQRALTGLEGTPAKWFKATLLVGADVRTFADTTRPTFDRNPIVPYLDGLLTFLPTAQDTVVVGLKRFMQPAFASCAAYQDSTYELSYKHSFGPKFTLSAGFKAQQGLWSLPVLRNDWIYTPTGVLSYTYNRHLSAELSYLHDFTKSEIPNTAGREYTRNLASLAVRWTL